MKTANWENWLDVVLGIWIMMVPWLFPLHVSPDGVRLAVLVSDSIAGAVIFGSAALALQELTSGEEWTNLVMGIWIFLSPWVLGYTADNVPFWNALIAGGLVAVSSAIALPIARHRGPREQG